jgi:regulator of protease activity HflC (stomatin/prohibitin superfamily)
MADFDKGKIPDVFPPDDSDRPPLRRRRRRGGKLTPLSAVALAAVVVIAAMAVTGRLGFINIRPDQVAVKVNYLTGDETPITSPGYQFYFPLMQDVFVLDKRVQSFEMRGNEYRSESFVPELTVRANDGSNFKFSSIELQYQLVPSQATRVLTSSGPADGYKAEWIKVFARSILRDEFGRFTAEEIADPGKLQMAFAGSEDRLNAELEPYGIRILDIPQMKPVFDPAYEEAIEDRKVADQDVERLIAMEDQLVQEREQQLAKVEREKSIEMEQLLGELDRERLESERAATQTRKSADAFAIERVAGGNAERSERVAQARGLVEKYTKEAQGVTAQAEALAQQGEVVVREALIEKLASIRFTFVPYSRDPAPQRLEHVDDRGGDAGRGVERVGSKTTEGGSR